MACLFAGTGAIGIQALGRGAAEAHFEMDPWVTGNVLNKNIKTGHSVDGAHRQG